MLTVQDILAEDFDWDNTLIDEEEFEQLRDNLIIHYLQEKTPKERQLLILAWNFDNSRKIIRWIVDQPDTDKGTALFLYWHMNLGFYKKYQNRDECEKENIWALEDYDIITAIEENYLSGFYKNQKYAFNPSNDVYCSGYDWTEEIDPEEIKSEIPREMFLPLEGETAEHPDWEEGIPDDLIPIMDKLYDILEDEYDKELRKYEEEEKLSRPKDVSESELLQDFVKFFDCEWEFFPEGTEYDLIINRFKECIEEGKEKNYIPMLLSVNHTLMTNMAISVESRFNNLPDGVAYYWMDFSMENVRKYRQEMTSSELPDGKQVLNRLKSEKYDSIKNFNAAWTDKNLQYIKSDSVITFPELIINYTGETTAVFIVKIPVKNPWEIFAWLPMGNWNYCPAAEDLMAISKYWYEKHGAIPCAVSYYGIEYRLEKPVSDPKEAFEAAAEMLAFCPDVVGSNLKSVGEQAGTLMNSTIWHFWWD